MNSIFDYRAKLQRFTQYCEKPETKDCKTTDFIVI